MYGRCWQGAIAALVALALPMAAAAQGLIRDAEIERTLGRVTEPILRAAGLAPGQVKIYIIDNARMNAFVGGGNNIFINTGMLRRLKTIDQLQSVVAHEVGHIVGGHLARRNENIRAAQGTAGIGMLLALAAALAGSREGAASAGILSQQVAERNLLAHTRAEEASADQASLRFMVGAGADPGATLEVMKLFRGQEAVSGRYADPYVRTHPLWSQRIRYLEDRIANAPKGRPPSDADAYWHRRMVAKFEGFTGNPRETLRKYGDDKTEIGAMARAIAYYRLPDLKRARAAMAALLKARPDDPFYQELNGQFLLETGDPKAAAEAYRRAVALAPKEPLILSGLGRALVAMDTKPATTEALEVLRRARQLDKADAMALRNLATVYARLGQGGQASLATAERFMLAGRFRDAEIHATRAIGALPEGSPGWRQAQDILRSAKRGGH